MSISTKNTCNFLETLDRFDLSTLISECHVSIQSSDLEKLAHSLGIQHHTALIAGPKLIIDAVESLPDFETKRIAEAIISGDDEIRSLDTLAFNSTNEKINRLSAEILANLILHREMMINVSVGRKRIQEVDDYYKVRERRIREMLPADVKYDNPHSDLWSWYHHWSKELPSYASRRQYVRDIFGPAIATVSKRSTLPSEPRLPTGWERVDRAMAKARQSLATASNEEEFQAIGLLCREVIISVGQAVYDAKLHGTLDVERISDTDGNRMITAYVQHRFPGASFDEIRAHARAAMNLALKLQHSRTATHQIAALCVEATGSTAAVIKIIHGE